jgi:hypothetical protein
VGTPSPNKRTYQDLASKGVNRAIILALVS